MYFYDKETATLTVHKRCKEVGKVIFIEKPSDYSLQYHPSQTVYTGATVGGGAADVADPRRFADVQLSVFV